MSKVKSLKEGRIPRPPNKLVLEWFGKFLNKKEPDGYYKKLIKEWDLNYDKE